MAREFLVPPRVIWGKEALGASAEYIRRMGKKALIVTGPHVAALGGVEALQRELEKRGVSSSVFAGITGEPEDWMIDRGTEAYKKEACDFLIGFGGGSPLDSMKAIAVQAAGGKRAAEYYGKVIEEALPPMAAIPTTAGTGSETTQFTIITDTEKGIKMLLKGPCLMPDLAVLDPALSESAPPSVTAATGLDALTHAAEAYTSKKAQPLADTLALSAVKRIFAFLPEAYENPGNDKAREEMALAAFEAGAAFNNSSVTLIHGMSRPIGALFHVPHGVSNAMLLPDCFAYALGGACVRFADMARAAGLADSRDSDEEAAKNFLEGIRGLILHCRIPTLEEFGVDKERFFGSMEKMAEDALASGSPQNTRKSVDKDVILSLYRGLWE
ncbi:MAG TPA: iron-containing alcohol dehydrogenase [Candidatus Limivivens intestinipullorum]|uniref:Iron-containing alcohol dehydrogenase n=1 Tax=Candidatus Limivivens intestinipullorum TaxID=2840858 RepID=A0A9D1EVL4_9FIRM|nr:iron-containing alcohol dehydrogenase [Candidatus Limivivens intestinipullorum]